MPRSSAGARIAVAAPLKRCGVITALSVLIAGCGGMARNASGHDLERPTSCAATEPCASPQTGPSGPETVTPRPGMADVHPVPFESATPEGDGSQVRVVWWSGVEPCNVLDHVEVVETASTVTITLYEGHGPGAGDVACIEIAVQKATLVRLDKPLGNRELVDGAKRRESALHFGREPVPLWGAGGVAAPSGPGPGPSSHDV